MYDVTIRKFCRHTDGSTVLYEDAAKVNHERHASNLAAKIARDKCVEWVEVEEAAGRFKARASLASDGTVHESLESGRHKGRREGRSRFRRRRKRGPIFWIVLVAFPLFGLLALITNK
ncbi:MAG TPA: hypothetical protein VGT03_10065 [Candidatus Acidoferrales bacterium]|nr:hypothetical protein [Candidatus Acidoferrales bacterium]